MQLRFVLVLGLAAVSMQTSLPSCATTCITELLPTSCNGSPSCICSASTFIDNISCCIYKACDTTDQEEALAYAKSICVPAGVTDLPTAATCTSTTSSTATSASGSSTDTATATTTDATTATTTTDATTATTATTTASAASSSSSSSESSSKSSSSSASGSSSATAATSTAAANAVVVQNAGLIGAGLMGLAGML